MHFIEFKNNSSEGSWSCFVNKMFEILGPFQDTASHYTQYHEYHYSMHVQFKFAFFEKIQLNENKLTKYSNWFRKCTKFRHGVPSTVRGLQKKFGGQNIKKNWFAECHLLTLGKYVLCQVPDGRHSAKCSLCRVFVGTLGKERANFFFKCLPSASPPGTR